MTSLRNRLQTLDQRLATPSPALEDPEEIRRARTLCRIVNTLGIILTISAVISLGTSFFFPDPDTSLGYGGTAMIAAAAAAFWVSLQLARRPRYQIGAWTMMFSIDAFLVSLSMWAPEFSVSLVLGFTVPVLLSTIVLRVRGTIVVFLLTSVLTVAWVLYKVETVNERSFVCGIVIVVSALTMLVSVLREQDLAGVRRLRELERADAERIRSDLELARRVQLAMLPDAVPEVPGAEVATYSEAAFEASGDFYDVIQLGAASGRPGSIGIVVCDVAGKGVASALVMAAARAALRSEAERNGFPGSVLRRVNNTLAQSVPSGLFVTAFYGVFDPSTRVLRFASGGHPHPVHHRRGPGETVELVSHGFPLGLVPDAVFDEATVTLEPGDLVVAYTDGLVEALDVERRMYGFDTALQNIAASAAARGGAGQHLGRVVADMQAFIGDERLHDDVTIVVLAVEEDGSEPHDEVLAATGATGPAEGSEPPAARSVSWTTTT